MSSNVRRRIRIVVFPGFELLDLSGPLCAFNLASEAHQAPYLVDVISAHGGTVASGWGLPIHTSRASRGKPVDTLLVVGGPPDSAVDGDADTVALIRKLAPRARRVASVCTGAFLLATAGRSAPRAIGDDPLEICRRVAKALSASARRCGQDIREGWQRLDIGRDHVRHRFDARVDRGRFRDRSIEGRREGHGGLSSQIGRTIAVFDVA